MSSEQSLEKLYDELSDSAKKRIFVVPLIRYNYKNSDYLYLLYERLIANDAYIIEDLSVWQHWKLVLAGIRKKNHIIHYHWFECQDIKSLAGMFYKFICLFLSKMLGANIVWTCHNKMPHDGRLYWLNFKLRKWLAHSAKRIHIHCKSVIPEISGFFKVHPEKFRVIPHPEYPAEKVERFIAIKEINHQRNLDLNESDTIFLMFGNISQYKGIEDVCRIFRNVEPSKKLLIVGPVKKGQMQTYRNINKLAEGTKNIIIIPHFIKESNVPFYFNASDCAIFNYKTILTSGGVVLARSYKLPVMVPPIGCLGELKEETVHFFDNTAELEKLVKDFKNG